MKRTLSLLAVFLGLVFVTAWGQDPAATPDAVPQPVKLTAEEQQHVLDEMAKLVGRWKVVEVRQQEHTETPAEYTLEFQLIGDHMLVISRCQGHISTIRTSVYPPNMMLSVVDVHAQRQTYQLQGVYQFESPTRLRLSQSMIGFPKSIDESGLSCIHMTLERLAADPSAPAPAKEVITGRDIQATEHPFGHPLFTQAIRTDDSIIKAIEHLPLQERGDAFLKSYGLLKGDRGVMMRSPPPAAVAKQADPKSSTRVSQTESSSSKPATQTKVFTLMGCTASDGAHLLGHLNPTPAFQDFGNYTGFRLVVMGTPEELLSAEKTFLRLQESITQIKEGDNKLSELVKSLGTEHPDVLKLSAEQEALFAEIVKLEVGLNDYAPAPDATSDFQLGVVLHRTKPAEAARILKLVINDDRFTAEPEGDNIVRVKYRSATKAEVEAMASVLEQMEKPDAEKTATANAEPVPQATTPNQLSNHQRYIQQELAQFVGRWKLIESGGEQGQDLNDSDGMECTLKDDHLLLKVSQNDKPSTATMTLDVSDAPERQRRFKLTKNGTTDPQNTNLGVYGFSFASDVVNGGSRRLEMNLSLDGTYPQSTDERGDRYRLVYEYISGISDEHVSNSGWGQLGALGLPTSAIPGKDWISSGSVIVVISDDQKQALGYCEAHPRWVSVTFDPKNAAKPEPIASGNSVAIQHGHQCHAFSSTHGQWATVTLPVDEAAVPVLSLDSITVRSPTKGEHVFKNAWGRWFSIEEIRSGKVAEHLAQADSKSPDSPSSVLPGADTPTTPVAKTQNVSPAQKLLIQEIGKFVGHWRLLSVTGQELDPKIKYEMHCVRKGHRLTVENHQGQVIDHEAFTLDVSDDPERYRRVKMSTSSSDDFQEVEPSVTFAAYEFIEGDGPTRLRINRSKSEKQPASVDETGEGLFQLVYEKLRTNSYPDRYSISVSGGSVRLALSNDGKRAYAYSVETPAWIAVDLDDNEPSEPDVTVHSDIAFIHHGNRCLAFSRKQLRWASLTLPEGEYPAPTVINDTISVLSPSKGDYAFKDAWGKWFTSEEVQAGKVEEHLAQADSKSPDSPSPEVPGTDTPPTPFVETQNVPPRLLVDYTCKYRSAEAARRLICALYQNIPPEHLVADVVGNRMLYLGTDNQTAKYLQGILPAWDQRTDGPIGEQVRLQVEELQSQLIRQKNVGSDSIVVKSLELRIAALENALKQDGGNEMLVEDRVPSTQTASVKVFALQHTQATEVAEVLKQLYDQGPAKIVPDARTNSVIVTGPEGQLQEIEALLLKLDESGQAPQSAAIQNLKALLPPLRIERAMLLTELGDKHPKVTLIDTQISSIQNEIQNLQNQSPTERIIPIDLEAAQREVQFQDELTKQLQTLGPEHPKVKELQARLDAASAKSHAASQEPSTHGIRHQMVQHSPPAEVAAKLQQLYKEGPFTISSDAQANTVVVSGPANRLQQVADIIGILDQALTPSRTSGGLDAVKAAIGHLEVRRSTLEAQQKEHDRFQQLVKEGAVSQQQVEEVDKNLRAAKHYAEVATADLQATRNQFKVDLLRTMEESVEFSQKILPSDHPAIREAETQIAGIVAQADTSPEEAQKAAGALSSKLEAEATKMVEAGLKSWEAEQTPGLPTKSDDHVKFLKLTLAQLRRRERARTLVPGASLPDRNIVEDDDQGIGQQSGAVPITTDASQSQSEVRIDQPQTQLSLYVPVSRILVFPKKITTVDGFDASVLNVTPVSPTQVRLTAESAGLTTLTVVDEASQKYVVEVLVLGADVRIAHFGADLQKQISQLRSEYAIVDEQVKKLATTLQSRPDDTQQSELRQLVQRAFTARQSLLRAELMEMQTRLLQTQRSIDLRERISDQIIHLRVEDLLNPQLKWEGNSNGGSKGDLPGPNRSESQTPDLSHQIPAGMRVVTVRIDDPTLAQVSSVAPGDKVDLLIRDKEGLPATLLECVGVFAVDSMIPSNIDEKRRVQHVSLLVTPEMAKAALLAQECRWLSLSSRSPQDVEESKLNLDVLARLPNRTRMDDPAVHIQPATEAREGAYRFTAAEADFNIGYALSFSVPTRPGQSNVFLAGLPIVAKEPNHAPSVAPYRECVYSVEVTPEQLAAITSAETLFGRIGISRTAANEPTVVNQYCRQAVVDAWREKVRYDEQKDAVGPAVEPSPADPEADALAKLQGKWHLTIRSPGPVLSNPDTYEAEAEVEGNLMKVFYTKELDASIPEERFLAHTVMLRVQRSEGKPQIDLLFGPNEEKVNRFLALGIAEFSEDVIRLCFDRSTDSESIRPEVFAVGAKAAIWELRRTPPADSKAGILARLQGLWVAEFETDPNTVDPAEAKHPGIALDASDVVFDVSGNVVTTSYITPHPDKPELPAWPEFSLQLGDIGKPQPVDLLWKTSTDPEGDGHVGIMEFSGEEVRLCFGDVEDRPQTFAAVKDYIYLVRLKRPSRESALHLGVQLAASPVGPDLLKDTPFRGGLRIEKVYAGTPAAEGGLLAGDVLVGLGAWEVAKLEDLQYALGLSLEGEVSFHILRDGQVRKGYVLLDGTKRPTSDAELSPEQLVKLTNEYQRGHSTPASQSEPQAALLAQLQGTWDVDLSGADDMDDLPPGTRAEFTIEGNLLKLWEIVPPQPGLTTETLRTEAGAMLLTLGAAGPPQQVDLVIGPNDGDQRRETQGIIEITGDTVKLCYDSQKEKGAIQRPAAFAKGKQATMWTLTRRKASAPATELEGDWKLESYRSKDGTVLNPNHADAPLLEIRGNEVFYDSGRNPSKIEIDADWKTLSYQKDSEDEPSTYRYLLKGDQLTLRNAGESVLVYRRQTAPPSTGQPTELEGDWHRVAVTAVDGTPIETPHFNVTIRGTTWTNQTGQTPEVIKIQTNLEKKTIEFSSTPPVLYAYELDGNRLILRDETLTMVLERGHIPAVVVAPTELEGDWHLETDGKVDRPPNNLTIHGDQYTVSSPNDSYTLLMTLDSKARTIQLASTTDAEVLTKSTYELSGDRLTMRGGDPPQVNVWSRGHRSWAVTELEGDWHVVAYYDHEGKPKETLPSNRSFRGDRSSFVGPGRRHDCRIKVDPIKKTLWSYSKEEDGSFGQDYYELKGDQLILRNEPGAVGYQVFERGLVRIPSVVPPANEEQKLLWRSAIVVIVATGNSDAPFGGREHDIGRGIVISSDGKMLSQLTDPENRNRFEEKFNAKFDDGSMIPLKLIEDAGQGWAVLQPEQPISVNHHFELSTTEVQLYDEVRIWGLDHSRPGNDVTLAPFANTVTALDRKYPALGIAVWQFRIGHQPVLGTPILDADGDLLGITVTGTRDLLLAVPVAQLKALFPKTFGQPPAAAAPMEPTEADKARWKSAVVEIVVYGKHDAFGGGHERVLGRGVVVSKDGLILTHLAGGWASSLDGWKILARFDDGNEVHLSVAEEGGGGMLVLQPKDAVAVNHDFPWSSTAYSVGDEVYVGQKVGLAFGKTKVLLIDRKIATGPSPAWQLEKQAQPDLLAGQPVLSSSGELVGLTLQGSGELLLAVPVALLNEMFPTLLGHQAENTIPAPKPRSPDEIASRLKALQGTWTIDFYDVPDKELSGTPLEIRITGNQLTIVGQTAGKEGQVTDKNQVVQIDLTDGADERAIDLFAENLRGREPRVPARCIYEVDGNKLAICFRHGPRPVEFGADAETQTGCIRCVRKADVPTESPSEATPVEPPPKGP